MLLLFHYPVVLVVALGIRLIVWLTLGHPEHISGMPLHLSMLSYLRLYREPLSWFGLSVWVFNELSAANDKATF